MDAKTELNLKALAAIIFTQFECIDTINVCVGTTEKGKLIAKVNRGTEVVPIQECDLNFEAEYESE